MNTGEGTDEKTHDTTGVHYNNCIVLILFPIIVFSSIASASSHYDQLSVTRLAIPELHHENVWAVTQDNSGFLWMATTSGLKRFDGNRIVTFTSQIRNTASLPNMNVRAVYAAADGNLWVTTQAGGLSLFDPFSKDFKHFKPNGEAIASAESTIFDFYSIAEDSRGRLWLTNFPDHTIYVFDPADGIFIPYTIGELSGLTFIQPQILAIIEDQIWVGTDGSGIAVIDSEGNLITYYRADSTPVSNLLSNRVQSIKQDSGGRIWVGTLGGGLQWFNKSTGTFVTVLNSDSSVAMDYIYSIEEDNSGMLWVGGNNGLLVLDSNSGALLAHYRHDTGNTASLTNNMVRAVFFDESGTVWVGNQSGGLHQMRRNKPFFNFTTSEDNQSVQFGQSIRSFHQYSGNSILLGAGNGDIYVFNMQARQVTQSFLANETSGYTLSAHEATAFVAGNSGSLWFGTWGNGLRYFQSGSGLVRTFRHERGNPDSIPDNRVQLLRKSTDGIFWVGTESGLATFDPENGNFRRVMHQPIGWPPLGFASVQSLAFSEDQDSVYWIGTWQGLFRYDHANSRAVRFNHDIIDENTLSSNHVTSLYDDGSGALWVGTFGGGLNRLDKSTGNVELFTVEHGLSNNSIFGLLPDDNGNLWISTSGGLSRFNLRQNTFMNFDLDDGLANQFFWWGAAYKANNGYMFFGHTSGFTMFHPDSISQAGRVPPVVITSVRVFDQEIAFDSQKTLVLTHRQNYLTFDFAVLDFFNPSRNQYAYKMDGINSDWVFSGSQNSVSFASLRGGEYNLRVRGANSDGVWNDDGVTLRISIKPPFWQTKWFYFLLVISGISMVLAFIHVRTRVIRARNENLELEVSRRTSDLELKQQELLRSYVDLREQTELLRQTNFELERQKEIVQLKSAELERKNLDLETLNQEKNNLIGIVAHDLRSPLSAVVSGLQLISMQPDMSKDQLIQTINTMDGFIRKQLDMISRILDVESLESGVLNLSLQTVDLRDVVQNEVDNAAVTASGKNISLKIDTIAVPVPVFVDVRYLGQAVENLVSNALKFSPIGGSVSIKVTTENDKARFVIQDQGPGITANDQKKLFGRFQKLSAKPTGGEKSIGLGLSIVKRFVEAMGGTVWCESKPGNGAAFIIELDLAEDMM
jgi:signal transduction histidine kinase/ligand-binding sensor domain-containing protein